MAKTLNFNKTLLLKAYSIMEAHFINYTNLIFQVVEFLWDKNVYYLVLLIQFKHWVKYHIVRGTFNCNYYINTQINKGIVL